MLPLLSISQESPYKYLQREGTAVQFIKVYDSPGITAEALRVWLKSKPNIKNVETDGECITAYISDWAFDYKKFGYTLLTAGGALLKPVFADILIQIKPDKYRVVASNIILDKKQKNESVAKTSSFFDGMLENMEFSSLLLNTSRTEWKRNKSYVKMYSTWEQGFSDFFNYSSAKSDNW